MIIEKLSQKEKEVMDYIWSQKKLLCRQDLVQHFSVIWEGQSDKKVAFFLTSLVKKGFIKGNRQGRHFYYITLILKQDYSHKIVNESLQKNVGESLNSVLAAFCGKSEITESEINKIEKWLSALEAAMGDD